MNGVPIIRLEVEGMRLVVHQALMEHAARMDADVQAAIERAITPENVSRIVQETAAREVRAAIDSAIESFYRFGAGRDVIRREVEKTLTERTKA